MLSFKILSLERESSLNGGGTFSCISARIPVFYIYSVLGNIWNSAYAAFQR